MHTHTMAIHSSSYRNNRSYRGANFIREDFTKDQSTSNLRKTRIDNFIKDQSTSLEKQEYTRKGDNRQI